MKHIFLHIVKTAGTSVRWTIRENYRPLEYYERDQEKFNWNELTQLQKNEIKMIFGHLYFGVHHHINHPCKYITFLRDPVERVISYYYYVLQRPDNPGYNSLKDLSLEDFVLKGDKRIVENQQTKIICGFPDEANFDRACNNIQTHFEYVGLVEDYQNSIGQMSKILNWKTTPIYEFNSTENKLIVNQEVKDLIKSVNEIDYQLYNWIQKSKHNV